MTENLAFEYKLPKVLVEMIDSTTRYSIDQVMGCVNYEDKVFENYEAAEGRYYTWNSAMGVGDFRATMSATELARLDEKDQIIGACPAGWRLPTKDELEALSSNASVAGDGFAGLDDGAGKEVDFNIKFLGYYDASGHKVADTDKAYFWSGAEVENSDGKQAYGMVVTTVDEATVRENNKVYAFNIRCVKDTP